MLKKTTIKFVKEHFRSTLKFAPEILKNKTQWKHEGQRTLFVWIGHKGFVRNTSVNKGLHNNSIVPLFVRLNETKSLQIRMGCY